MTLTPSRLNNKILNIGSLVKYRSQSEQNYTKSFFSPPLSKKGQNLSFVCEISQRNVSGPLPLGYKRKWGGPDCRLFKSMFPSPPPPHPPVPFVLSLSSRIKTHPLLLLKERDRPEGLKCFSSWNIFTSPSPTLLEGSQELPLLTISQV